MDSESPFHHWSRYLSHSGSQMRWCPPIAHCYKGQDLSAYTGSLSNPALADKELTLQGCIDELLKWAAVNESQLGTSAQDRVNLAKSMGMMDKEGRFDGSVQGSNLQSMYAAAAACMMPIVLEKKAPLF